jgi:hypothetical protein
MATIIKRGSAVHAHYRTESGYVLGSPCRFKGIVTVVQEPIIYMTDEHGDSRYFGRAAVHHADDCPAKAKGTTNAR